MDIELGNRDRTLKAAQGQGADALPLPLPLPLPLSLPTLTEDIDWVETTATASDTAAEKAAKEKEYPVSLLVLLSVLASSANQILYKMTLNVFSSRSSNYGFFVSQFSTLLYFFQALVVSSWIVSQYPASLKELVNSAGKQWAFLWMGLLDGASSTLGTIAGAFCPGELQTLINQSIIPITMVLSYFFLNTTFQAPQIAGSSLILVGVLVASSNFIFGDNNSNSNGVSISSNRSQVTAAAIGIYFLSVFPGAISNVYKDVKMKSEDLNEVHTSTVVSFYQLVVGFIFLPLLQLPALGGLDSTAMKAQMWDGFRCFYGENPTADDNCRSAWSILLAYIAVNFAYNLLLLAITKKGSAVLLVVSQALALPVTNIAFTIPAIMGNDIEPLSFLDLVGLVLVAIGFLAYAGLGFAKAFLVAQGPPGQMAYASIEINKTLVVPSDVVGNPVSLAALLTNSIHQQSLQAKRADHRTSVSDGDRDGEGKPLLPRQTGHIQNEANARLKVAQQALDITRRTVHILRQEVAELQRLALSQGTLVSTDKPAIVTASTSSDTVLQRPTYGSSQ